MSSAHGPALLALLAGAALADEPRFLKGQLHLHTDHSRDGHTPPEAVAPFYAALGYDFIVFTDHNQVTTLAHPPGRLLALPGVELTQNFAACDPPGDAGTPCYLHVNALFVRPGE